MVICVREINFSLCGGGTFSSFSKDNAAYVGNTTGTAQEPFVKGLLVGGGATSGQGYVDNQISKGQMEVEIETVKQG